MAPKFHEDFYVGYQKLAPAGLGRFTRKVVVGLIAAAALVALAVATSHAPPSQAAFEFGVERSFEGVVVEAPYPMLRVERPGTTGADEALSRLLLVAFGKNGASEEMARLDGQRVRLAGTLVYAPEGTMIEVVAGSVEALGPARLASHSDDLGKVALTGEIVDSKCYLGVMKPGLGKPHRSCASMCIRGGVPPALLMRGPSGSALALLTDLEGRAINDRILDWVAQPVKVTGRAKREGDLLIVAIDVDQIEAL